MVMRLKQLIGKFLKWCERLRKPATVTSYRYLLNKFLRHVGNKPINKLLPVHLEMYGKTWHEVQSVQRLFQWAKQSLRVVKENVFAEVPRPAAGQRTRTLSPRELIQFIRRSVASERKANGRLCGPDSGGTRFAFRHFLLALRETLARPGELRALNFEWLKSENERLTIEQALHAGKAMFVLRDYKARQRRKDPNALRVILVNCRLGRLILRLYLRSPSRRGPVFCNAKGKRWSNNAVRCRMRRLRNRLRLPADFTNESIVAYHFRHSTATIAIGTKNVGIKIVSEILGHADVKTTQRYTHLQVEHMRRGMEMIEDRQGNAARREAQVEELREKKKAA